MAVAFGIHAFASSRAPIPAGPPPIGGRVVTSAGGAAQRLGAHRRSNGLLGLRGGLVPVGGLVVAHLGIVITPVCRSITLTGLVIPAVCGLVPTIGGALRPRVPPTGQADTHGNLTSLTL